MGGKDFDLKLFDDFEPALVPLDIKVGGECDAVVLVVDSKHLRSRVKQGQIGLTMSTSKRAEGGREWVDVV